MSEALKSHFDCDIEVFIKSHSQERITHLSRDASLRYVVQ